MKYFLDEIDDEVDGAGQSQLHDELFQKHQDPSAERAPGFTALHPGRQRLPLLDTQGVVDLI